MDFDTYLNLLNHQKSLPYILWISVFGVLAVFEIKWAGYPEKIPCLLRWPGHFSLVIFNALLFRVILPSFCLWSSLSAYHDHFGLFNRVLVPNLFGFVFTLIVLDWTLYYLHRAFHFVPWLWKIHRVHHTDNEVDVTTGFRFHPFEIFITKLVESMIIFLIGAPVYGVFLFETCMGISFLFNHSNIQIPTRLEVWLRRVCLTPDMHRVHHSIHPDETNSNFGFIFSWWDRLFTTYHGILKSDEPELGLPLFRDTHYSHLKELLLQPFLDRQGHFRLKNFTQDE